SMRTAGAARGTRRRRSKAHACSRAGDAVLGGVGEASREAEAVTGEMQAGGWGRGSGESGVGTREWGVGSRESGVGSRESGWCIFCLQFHKRVALVDSSLPTPDSPNLISA